MFGEGKVTFKDDIKIACGVQGRVISRNLKVGGSMDKCLGGRKHTGSANLQYKTLKNRKNYK